MNGYFTYAAGRRIPVVIGRDTAKRVTNETTQKRQQYESSYPCPRYSKPFYERFSSYEEANLRIAQIEYEKSLGVFQPPTPIPTPVRSMQQKSITVGELMDKYVQVYSMNHRGDSFLSCSKHRIEHYPALSWECSREGTDHS